MALQQFDLNRAGDTPISTLKLGEITPVNWHKFPPPMPPTNPIYVPVVSFNGGVVGDDVSVATAAATDAYTPRTQAEKASLIGTTLAVDVTRPRGAIEPDDPYPKAGDTPPAAPTITSLAPNTAVAVTGPDLVVTITGTGFTQWSTVTSGNFPIPVRYVSPTKLEIVQKPRSSVAGIVTVVVSDHGVASAPSNFTFT